MGAQEKVRDLVTAMDGAGVAEERREEEREGGKMTASAAAAAAAAVSSIPRSPISIDISLPLPQMKPHVEELCKDLFKKWSSLDSSCFAIETVSGGITNQLLKVSVREANGNDVSLTVRLYGPNTDLVIDREREMQALPHLSAAGFGAELLGLFENGMVQSFINARTLSPPDLHEQDISTAHFILLLPSISSFLLAVLDQLRWPIDQKTSAVLHMIEPYMSNPKIAAEIARQLCKFHQVEIPGSREPQLWNDVCKFLEKAETLKFDDTEKQKMYETISFKEIREEVNGLKDLANLLNAPVVFSHNDLLSGNLMLNEKEEKLYFIDFEYGSYSYRGYDIANHFNEYAGYECDYTLYPDKNAQYHFFRNYLQPDAPHEVPDKDLDDLYVETSTFRLASHLYWAIWALIQAKMSPIDFDYLGYFFLRYNEYKKHKEACFSLARKYLSGSSIP